MSETKTLQITTPSDTEITMTRVFDAPRHLVFDALTKPELVKEWLWGPHERSLIVCEMDLREGGAYRYVWRLPNGNDMGAGGVFLEISRPDRLVQTEVFDDAWYEGESVITTTLVEHEGRTTMSATMRYISKEVRDAVLRSPMETGVVISYDRLNEVLQTL